MFTDAATHAGATVVRIHLNGVAFEPAIGKYSEKAFVQLDACLAAAQNTRLQIMICLRDYLWSSWPVTAYDPYWTFDSDWTIGQADPSSPAPNKDTILTSNAAKTAFKAFISYVVNRKNTITGKTYKNDSTVFGWEIINEPNTVPGQLGPWLDEMCAYLDALDPVHPIGVSLPGVEPDWWAADNIIWNEFDTPQLDFIALHYYADLLLYGNPPDQKNLEKYKSRVQAAADLGKTVYLTEFGVTSSEDHLMRARMYSALLSASAEAGVKGVFPYSWGPPGPNGWGGVGGFPVTSKDKDLCYLMKKMADAP